MLHKKKFDILYSFFLIPIFLLISNYFLMVLLCGMASLAINIKAFIFNIIIVEFFYVFLFFEFKNSFKSFITICVITFLFCFISQLKIDYMNDPLFISDINFIQNYSNISVFTGNDIFKHIFVLFVRSIPSILFNAFLIFLSAKFKIVIEKKNSWIYGIAMLLFLLLLLWPFNFSKKFYFKYIYSDKIHSVDSFVSYKTLYIYYGFFSGMYYQYLNSKIDYSIPPNYDEEKLCKLEDSAEKELNNIGRPNVVVILGESFYNINKLSDNISFDKNILEYYDYIKSKGYVVNTISPSFAGNTANVLYELLVGGNLSYFSEGFIPLVDLYRDNRERDSLVNVLKKNGYSTKIFAGADSYDIDNTLKKIGFDDYIVVNNEEIKGDYPSDNYMGELLINELDKKGINKFIVVETMQNHMPYYEEKYDSYDMKVKKTNLKKEDASIIKTYAQGLYDTNLLLKKIYDYIHNSDENTIVLFFGDHLPPLRNSSVEDIYLKLDYFNTLDKLVNTFRKYNMEAVVFSNYEINIDFPEYLGFDLLLNYIINNMDLEVSKYYKWLYSSSDVLPTYNRYVSINSDGNLSYFSKLSGDSKKMLELRKLMFYKNFIKK